MRDNDRQSVSVALYVVWIVTLLAVFVIGLLAREASGTTRRVMFNHPYSTGELARVGVLSDGVPLTSGVPILGADGIWFLDSHVMFGHETALVAFDSAGNMSVPSNVKTLGGCLWDRDSSGRVDIRDFASYRAEYGDGTAFLPEEASFKAAFGATCPQGESL